jgi:hypothetical protein
MSDGCILEHFCMTRQMLDRLRAKLAPARSEYA